MLSRHYGVLGIVVASLVASARSAPAQGLLDFLFKPLQPQASGSGEGGAPRLSGTGRYASYCVRLCDGRYFPVQRASMVEASDLCNSLCPASKTKVFAGSDINYATAGDGSRYSSLQNAFVYREKVVEGCTCNGTDSFGLAKIAVNDDPTLRRGDMIATETGVEKYNGPAPATASARNGTTSETDPAAASANRGVAETAEPQRERPRPRPTFSFFGLRF